MYAIPTQTIEMGTFSTPKSYYEINNTATDNRLADGSKGDFILLNILWLYFKCNCILYLKPSV